MGAEVFDVNAALKEFPESEVAAHLAELHGIDRNAYLKEGHTDAEFLQEYGSRPLSTPVVSAEGKTAPTAEEIDAQYSPVAGAGTGAILGGVGIGAKKINKVNKFIDALGTAADKVTPTEEYVAPGQKWSAKTGYGSGAGETVEDVVAARAKENAPIGRGKVSKNIKGPLGIDAAMEDIAVKEAEQQRLAKIRAQEKLAFEKAQQGIKQESKFAPITKPASMLPIAGASIGYNVADTARHVKKGETGQAAVSALGAAGAAAPLVKKLPPKYRAAGALMGLAAPVINTGVDAVQEKASGGAIKGGLEATKKLFAPKPTKIVRASEALGQHEGKWLNTTQSDRMRSTGGDLGGPGFSKFQLENPDYAGAAWGVGKPGTATAIVNTNKRYPEGQAIWAPMIGSEGQHQSNQHVFDALTQEFNRQASMGNLTPELREKMNAYLMSNKEYAPLFKKGIDVGNPESLAQMGDTFDRRGAISSVLGGKGVGGQKGQIFDYSGIMQDMTDPMTIGAPTHSVGTRLFNLSNEIEHRPDLHSAFPYILKGEDAGVAFNPVPKELAIPDWLGLVRDFKGREPGYMDYTRGLKGKGTPFQFIDEKYLRSLEEAGHAAGGHIEGYATGKKVIEAGLKALEPQETVKAYKLFRTDPKAPESLFPLFVNANKPVPIGQWIPAEAGELTQAGKVKSKIGDLAYRPGWHAGDMPIATHIGGKSSPDLKAPDFRPSNQVWAEVEMPADVDWQKVAMERAQRNKAGDIIPRTAHITDTIPEGGHYRYKTNPNMTGDWLIGGSMKVNRVLTPEEVMQINEAKGVSDLPLFEPFKK